MRHTQSEQEIQLLECIAKQCRQYVDDFLKNHLHKKPLHINGFKLFFERVNDVNDFYNL